MQKAANKENMQSANTKKIVINKSNIKIIKDSTA